MDLLGNDDNEFVAEAFTEEESSKKSSGRCWVNDLRGLGNFFYYEHCFRFMRNACKNFRGPFQDGSIFLPMAKMIHPEKLDTIIRGCTTKEIRENFEERRRSGRLGHTLLGEYSEVLRLMWSNPRSHTKFVADFDDWLQYAIETVGKWQEEKPDPVKDRFAEITKLFDLSEKELELFILVSMQANRVWPSEGLDGPIRGDKSSIVSALLGISEAEYLSLVKAKGKLHRFGCLDKDGDLQSEVIPFLAGVDEAPFINRFFKKCTDEVLPWPFFGSLGKEHGEFLKQLISGRDPGRGLNIIFYGEPGTGKSSFAQALARELGSTAYSITHLCQNPHSGISRNFRFAAVQLCNNQVEAEKSVIIIDEADEMLEGGRGNFLSMFREDTAAGTDKGLLNDLLDTVKTPCIWITNSSPELLDPSNLRRFDYSIKFKKLTLEQRLAIWNNAVCKFELNDVVATSVITRLAGKYEVSAGGITLAAQNLSAMLKSKTATAEDAEAVLEKILKPHCKLLRIDTASKEKNAVSSDYSLEGLNIKGSMKLEQIVTAIKRFQGEQKSQNAKVLDRPRMNILLSGMPGTGKTEFVKYLGGTLGMRVVTRMGSDLLDKYVGGTEKNIRQAFKQAAAERAILFLDEIDGIIQSRERAERSWEVTQVNELLHRMESFEGVLIGATNFANNLDPATLRRFTFKLEFDCLDDAGKELFFKRMFGSFNLPALSSAQEKRLRHIPVLTPGDFRTVRQGLYYLGEEVTTEQLLEGLERESAMKAKGRPSRRIGF